MTQGRPRGRPPGYKHSDETKAKIRESLTGHAHTRLRNNNIAAAKAVYDQEGKCVRRLEELRDCYPDQYQFFDENEPELLFAMLDVRSEKELEYIRKYVESERLDSGVSYEYASSSCYAAEEAMIALLDFKRFLEKFIENSIEIRQS